uniref:ADNP homeobox 2b n=1 Tax=Nothobranchius rachovii TaxID=451742 RepID=A0A1A8SDJ4_9TELE
MYQLPVGNVEKIRKGRRAVKNILSEIGLEDCQTFLKDLDENSEKNADEDEAFQQTDWIDITEGYSRRHRKKWPYRSRSLCCNQCKYSSQNLYNFRTHVTRCHGCVESFCTLTPCSHCIFISHPRNVKRHMQFFHSKVPVPATQPQKSSLVTHMGNERYQCRKCGFPNSSIFAMKKHVILKHLPSLADQYVGYRLQQQLNASVKIYCCKVCSVNTGTLDQMLHHLLVEPVHHTIAIQVQSYIVENKKYATKPTPNGNGLYVTFPSIAPKPQNSQTFTNNSLVLQSNGQSPGTVLALQQVQGATNSATLICTPGTNQAFLPPQASALVQLASAEAKGLLQPGATISLRSAPPQGSSAIVQVPTMTNVSLKPAPITQPVATTQPLQQQPPQAQQVVLPPGMQPSVSGTGTGTGTGTVAKQTKHIPLQGTMLTSQSLLSHLIPTGNRVNGMPTYTFAPLQATMPVSQRTTTPLQPVEQTSNSAPQTKKWVTCPFCNELFPSNVFELHTEAAHQTKSSTSRSQSLAARAASLKKMPDKTVKCLTCKILLSEKTLFQHLLHGLNCLYCSALFFSIKQLIVHVQIHNPSGKVYCDFLRQKYRVYSKPNGEILFPYIDVNTTAPKEILGDTEVNLALVTNTLDLIFFKIHPSNQQEICQAPVKFNSMYCPFCDEKFQNQSVHAQHLKQKHFVAPTIHAILKTEAFKCIYCNGVYTGKVTQQAVMLHIQRCRCSPKPPQPPKPPHLPKPALVVHQQQPPKPTQQISQTTGLYFVPMPQGLTMARTLAPARVITPTKPPEPEESEAEKQSKKRLEVALKEAMEANKREREQKAAMRKKREEERLLQEKLEQEKKLLQPEPEVQSDPMVKLLIEPNSMERRCVESRRDFITKYFNLNPYASKAETEELSRRLSLNKSELLGQFSKRRSKCIKSLGSNSAAILLGFNMTEMSKVKHNMLIPEQQPPVDALDTQQDDDEEAESPPPSTDVGMQARATEPESIDVSEATKASTGEQME